MKVFQPWSDTVTLLAGGRPNRAYRPDELAELPDDQRHKQRIRVLVQTIFTRLLLIIGIPAG